jgi:hypothetical protein
LIAYLLGGWLLPAAHHHVHHVETQLSASQESCGCATHEAPAEHDHESESTGDPAIDSLKINSCDGLCALCVTRSLCSPALILVSVSDAANSAPANFTAAPHVLPSGVGSQNLSRGPPVV